MKCLRKLIGSRRVLGSLETTYHHKCASNNPIHTPTTSSAFSQSHALPGGLANKFTPNPRSVCWQSEQVKGRCDSDTEILESKEKQFEIIEKGDTVNLSELLFTKNRDYLIRYNDPQLVTADHLAGKVVVLYFVRKDSCYSRKNTFMASLIDVYNDLKPKNCFEVVFVFVDDDGRRSSLPSSPKPEAQIFEDFFSLMPWTAIPFSDLNFRKYLKGRFRLSRIWSSYPIGIVVDATGMVLQTSCEHIIDIYGSPAYPFSDERLALLDSEDDIIAMQPSLKNLLASPQRDYVISNTGEKVPIHTLEDKVVALFFYEDERCYDLAEELRVTYEELARQNKKFEVVLIYLTDTCDMCKCTNEEKFRETFKTMPWLTLPFKDPIHKKLKRLFDHPQIVRHDMPKKAPSLVIFGPHGEFIEPCGAEVLSNFGVLGYPFTREHIVKSETKMDVELKLEMLCGPTTVFGRKDGSQVQFSHFVGKSVLIYIESIYWNDSEDVVTFKEAKFPEMLKEVKFLKMLKERYLQLKGTDYEFEVIYVSYQDEKICYDDLVADVPWFVSSASELFKYIPHDSAFFTYYGKYCYEYEWSFLLAFGRDGGLVRKTVCPKFNHLDFPFYLGSLEDEAFYKISQYFFSDGYWNKDYQGLLRNSFDAN